MTTSPPNSPDDRDHIGADRLQPYRQPMVTGTGIILGFVLNFAGTYVQTGTAAPEWIAYAVLALLLIGVAALIVTLSRILMLVPSDRSTAWYQNTRRWFLLGVICAVGGAMVDMFSTFVAD